MDQAGQHPLFEVFYGGRYERARGHRDAEPVALAGAHAGGVVAGAYNLVALVLANVNSYFGNAFWTFRGQANHGRRQTSLFFLQALANIAVSNGLFYLLVRTLLVYDVVPGWIAGNVAKVISIAVASVMSFFLMRYLVFARK